MLRHGVNMTSICIAMCYALPIQRLHMGYLIYIMVYPRVRHGLYIMYVGLSVG
jgi:hypothetical protein